MHSGYIYKTVRGETATPYEDSVGWKQGQANGKPCLLSSRKKKKKELRSVNSAALWERQVYDRSLLYVKLTVGLGLPWQNYYRTRKTLQ